MLQVLTARFFTSFLSPRTALNPRNKDTSLIMDTFFFCPIGVLIGGVPPVHYYIWTNRVVARADVDKVFKKLRYHNNTEIIQVVQLQVINGFQLCVCVCVCV